MSERKFKFRSLTSFLMFTSFIILSITGLILFIVPPGRVAKWVNWQLFWLDKEQWTAVHTLFSFLFLGFGILHIYYNWRVLINSLLDKIKGGLKRKQEAFATLLITIILLTGTILEIPPFQSIMDLGEYFKESWEKKEEVAPIPHAESLTIAEISKILNLDVETAQKRLNKAGIKKIGEKDALKDIAEKNQSSPFKIYQIIAGKTSQEKNSVNNNNMGGKGIGRMKLEQICIRFTLDCNKIREIFRQKKIKYQEDQIFKEIADENGKSPKELWEMIQEAKQ